MKAIEALAQIKLNLTSVEQFLSIASGLADDNPTIKEGVYGAAKEARASALLIDHLRNLFSHQQSIEAQQQLAEHAALEQRLSLISKRQHRQQQQDHSSEDRGGHFNQRVCSSGTAASSRFQLEQNSLLFTYSNQQALVRAAKCLAANVAKVLYLTDSVVLQAHGCNNSSVACTATGRHPLQQQQQQQQLSSQATEAFAVDFVVGRLRSQQQHGKRPPLLVGASASAATMQTPAISDRLDNVANYSQLLRSFGELSTELVDLGRCIMLSQQQQSWFAFQQQQQQQGVRVCSPLFEPSQQEQQLHCQSSVAGGNFWQPLQATERRNSASQQYNIGRQQQTLSASVCVGCPWLNGTAIGQVVRPSASTSSMLAASARGFASDQQQQQYWQQRHQHGQGYSGNVEELLQWHSMAEAPNNSSSGHEDDLDVDQEERSRPLDLLRSALEAAAAAGDQQARALIERQQLVEAQIQDMQILFQVNRLIIDRSILLLLSASKCCLRPGNECLRGLEARRSVVAQIRASISIIMAIVKCSVFSNQTTALLPTLNSAQRKQTKQREERAHDQDEEPPLEHSASNASQSSADRNYMYGGYTGFRSYNNHYDHYGHAYAPGVGGGAHFASSQHRNRHLLQQHQRSQAAAAVAIGTVNSNSTIAAANNAGLREPKRDNQFDHHYLDACQSPFSGDAAGRQRQPILFFADASSGVPLHHQAQRARGQPASTAGGDNGQQQPVAAAPPLESPLQIMDYFLRTWSGAQSAHDAISKLQLLVGHLTRVANYKCLVQGLDEIFADHQQQRQQERQLEIQLELELQSKNSGRVSFSREAHSESKELPSVFGATTFNASSSSRPFYASASADDKENIGAGCSNLASATSSRHSSMGRRPFGQQQKQRQEEEKEDSILDERAQAQQSRHHHEPNVNSSVTAAFLLMNRRELIGTLNSVFLGELRSTLIERAHEFTDCAYTKHEHRETIVFLLHCVKLQLNKLVKLLYRMRRKSSAINELNLGQLRQLAIQIEESCEELKYELQTVVIEQSDELDRCNSQLDLIKQLKHHCLVGDTAKAERCCSHFLEQSEQLVELCKMLNQVAPTHKMKITTKTLAIWFDSNVGQLLATAQCLSECPRSQVLKDCAWAYIQVWCSFYDDFCQLARQLAYLAHAHYDQERSARVGAWRDQVQMRHQLSVAAEDCSYNEPAPGGADSSNGCEGSALVAASSAQQQQSLQQQQQQQLSMAAETLSDITDSPRSLDHYYGFGANYQQQRRAARGHNNNGNNHQHHHHQRVLDWPPLSPTTASLFGEDHVPAAVTRSASPLERYDFGVPDFGLSPAGATRSVGTATASTAASAIANAAAAPEQLLPQSPQVHLPDNQPLSCYSGAALGSSQLNKYGAPSAASNHPLNQNQHQLHHQNQHQLTSFHQHQAQQQQYFSDLNAPLQRSNLIQPAQAMNAQPMNLGMMMGAPGQPSAPNQPQMQQQQPPPPILQPTTRRVVINEAASTVLQPPPVAARATALYATGGQQQVTRHNVHYQQQQQQQQEQQSGNNNKPRQHQTAQRYPNSTTTAEVAATIAVGQRRLGGTEAAVTATNTGRGDLTAYGDLSDTNLSANEESECDTEAQLASGGNNTDQQSSTTEADKWSDSDADAIVRGAKEIAQMALSMYQFTKGEGDLNTTQDLFTQAELFAEEANELYKEVRCFSYKVPAGELKKELLSQLGAIPALVQQLQFIVKNPTVGKPATFAKVDSVIRETRALMEAVNRVVTATLSCRQHYNMAIASMRKRTRTLSPSYRGDKGFEFENHSSARQATIGGRHGAGGGGMGSEPDI